MKLSSDMYHISTFCLPKSKGVNEWAGESHMQRNTEKYREIKIMSTLASFNNTLQMAMDVGIFVM